MERKSGICLRCLVAMASMDSLNSDTGKPPSNSNSHSTKMELLGRPCAVRYLSLGAAGNGKKVSIINFSKDTYIHV